MCTDCAVFVNCVYMLTVFEHLFTVCILFLDVFTILRVCTLCVDAGCTYCLHIMFTVCDHYIAFNYFLA